MSHKGIRSLIKTTARKLGDDIQFVYGRKSDVNQISDKKDIVIALDPLTSTASFAVNNSYNYQKIWTAQMAFYKIDHADSTEEQYAKILDDTDVLVDQFITKINSLSQIELITIQGISQIPFIKALADVMTGHALTFQISVPDDWNYCADGC